MSEPRADRILLGNVVTLDRQSSVAEAIAIRDGRITVVGSRSDILGLRGPQTDVHEVRGTITPGFNDTHAHMDTEGLRTCFPSLDEARSIGDILTTISKIAGTKPKGEWIVTMPVGKSPFYFGGPENLAERRMPTRQELDSAAPDHPVCILPPSSYWSLIPCHAALNSLGLARNGINRETQPRIGGVTIERDSDGEPTGVIVDRNYPDMAQVDLLGGVPKFTLADRCEGIRRAMKIYHAGGTTSVYEGHGCAPDILDAYGKLWRSNELTMRVGLVVSPMWTSVDEAERQMRESLSYARGSGFGDTQLRIGGLFVNYGGDPAAARVSMSNPTNLGWSSYVKHANDPESFERLCMLAAQHDLRIHTVVIDKLHEILPILRRVDERHGIRDKRWVLEHISIVREQDLPVIRELGLGVTLIPGYHIAKAGARYVNLDDAAASLIAPALQLARLGVPLSCGTDNSPTNPLAVMHAMVTRKEKGGRVIGEAARVAPETALRTLTVNGAWFSFDEGRKGPLAPGYLADLAVFDRNPLAVPPDELEALTCTATMVGGQVVHGSV